MYRARAATAVASGDELQMLNGFDYAVGSTNCSRKVEALPAAAALCR